MRTILRLIENRCQLRRAPRSIRSVIVVTRFRVPDVEVDNFRADLDQARRVLAERPGYVDGTVGRNVDDPELWVLTTRWQNVGAYRRALSSYDVKLHAVGLLGRALDEPSAYEVVEEGTDLNVPGTRSLG
jgi:quinol monooxygenase YgiN